MQQVGSQLIDVNAPLIIAVGERNKRRAPYTRVVSKGHLRGRFGPNGSHHRSPHSIVPKLLLPNQLLMNVGRFWCGDLYCPYTTQLPPERPK